MSSIEHILENVLDRTYLDKIFYWLERSFDPNYLVYNKREDNITIYTEMAVEVVEFCCLLLKGRSNESTKILIAFNLEVLSTAWDEMNPCAVSRRQKAKTVVELRRNKDAKVKAGVEMLSSGQ